MKLSIIIHFIILEFAALSGWVLYEAHNKGFYLSWICNIIKRQGKREGITLPKDTQQGTA